MRDVATPARPRRPELWVDLWVGRPKPPITESYQGKGAEKVSAGSLR
jgi:hypothetical protein